jgi:hypothetical protein
MSADRHSWAETPPRDDQASLTDGLTSGIAQETEAIIAIVPRSCRANARWAIPLLLRAARSGGITHLRRIAYVLATAQHASQFGGQLMELGSGDATDGHDRAFDRYEPGTPQGAALGNTEPGDGARFRGRGFVPVRGRAAYAIWSHRLGLPDEIIADVATPFFVAHPAAMAQPGVAAQTIVRGMRDGLFTGVALGSHVNDKRTDYVRARRVIDGMKYARDVAEIAQSFAAAMERIQSDRHWARMHQLSSARAANPAPQALIDDVRDAVERLAARGEIMPEPAQVVEWNGEARQGKFVQLDERTCALHMGRGTYVTLDVQRDLNGIVPPEGRNMALKRSGDVRPAARHGEVNFWR